MWSTVHVYRCTVVMLCVLNTLGGGSEERVITVHMRVSRQLSCFCCRYTTACWSVPFYLSSLQYHKITGYNFLTAEQVVRYVSGIQTKQQYQRVIKIIAQYLVPRMNFEGQLIKQSRISLRQRVIYSLHFVLNIFNLLVDLVHQKSRSVTNHNDKMLILIIHTNM